MRPIGTIASTIATGLALVSGTAVAQAQTAVTRQITSEPVETVITQGPNGAAVTRRILSPEPGIRTYAAPPLVYPPAAVEAVESQYYDYVEPAAPARPARRVTTTAKSSTSSTSRTVGLAPAHTRTATTREATARPARTATRTVTTVAAPPVAYDQPLVLSPAQRQVIYRTIAQREYYPAPDVYAPPPVTGYPLRTVYPADYAYRDYAYDPYYNTYNGGYRPDPYYDRDYRDPYHTAYRWDGVPLVVGARIPQSVPLYAVPEPVAFRIPAARSYSYALLDNRVFLVDPVTGVIVAEITQ